MSIACNALESGKPIYGRNGFPTAVPFDVRKASRLPASSRLNFGLRPGFGARFVVPSDGSAERFRTSVGIAESCWLNFLGKVAWCNSFNHQTF